MADAYQIGNRDGLLSFAKACDANEADEKDAADAWERAKHPQAARFAETRRFSAKAWSEAAALARRMAEALPVDPLWPDEALARLTPEPT